MITQNKSLKINLSVISEICLHSYFLEEFVSSWSLMSHQPCRVTSGWILTGQGFKWFSSFLALDGRDGYKLQALVYDILPSTTAVFSYTIGSRKLSANEQLLFFGAQTVVSLVKTTQIKQGVSFIAANKVYTSTNKTTIVWIEMEFFFLPGVDGSHVYVCALVLGSFCSLISTLFFQRALTVLLDSCAEIKNALSVV